MSLVDTLIEQGIVTQDPVETDKVIFNVDVHIKKDAVNLGAFQAFAAQYGYTPQIKDPGTGLMIDNPQTVYEKCKVIVWDFVREVFRGAMMKQAEDQARAQAKAAADSLIQHGLFDQKTLDRRHHLPRTTGSGGVVASWYACDQLGGQRLRD